MPAGVASAHGALATQQALPKNGTPMLHPVTFRTLAVACGASLACQAPALTLGSAAGGVLLGRPLELSVPVTLDPGEDSPCASAELLHGESRVRAPSVQWVPRGGGEGVLRIASPLPVYEPAVTLNLRVGCRQATQRSYVLLAEVPARNEASAPLVPAPVPQAPVASPAPTVPAPAAARLRTEPALPASPPAARAPVPAAPAAPRAAARAPAPAQSRLELTTPEGLPEGNPVLRMTASLLTAVTGDAGRREAAAALWQALQKTPDQALQEALRLENAERELKSLRASSQQNAAAVAQMRAQVEQARDQRSSVTWLVMGLSAALAAMLAGLAWRWHRARRMARVGRWFADQPGSPADTHAGEPGSTGGMAAAAAPAATARPAKAAKAGLVALPAPAATTAPAAPAASTAPKKTGRARSGPPSTWGPGDEYQTSRGGSVRMVGVEELLDVHDKADFFLSIGEPEQAMAVLEAHVHDQVDTSALPWLDLFELYHRLGKRTEFERLRREFGEHFTVQVPEFERFDQPSAPLENYGRALSRIEALWGTPRVLDVIEEAIFRKPGLPGAEPFSLEAYRELVLLYHVARELMPEGTRAAPGTGTSDTSLQPLNALDMPVRAAEDPEALLIPPSTPRLGVDIDLGDAGPAELPPLEFDISERSPLDAPPGRRR